MNKLKYLLGLQITHLCKNSIKSNHCKFLSTYSSNLVFNSPQKHRSIYFYHQTTDMALKHHLDVQHDKEKCEFFIDIEKSENNGSSSRAKAFLEYSWVDKNIIDMHHTLVPSEFRGQGVAKILAKEALEFAVKEDLKYHLSCTYLQKYVNDNPLPKYTERIASL